SSIGMGRSSFVGVYWRNEWGAHDFDLSGVFPYEDIRIGWNAGYTTSDERVVYSGDMTDAKPEASEILYFRNGAPDGFIFVNRFNGDEGASYRLFFGAGEPEEKADHMVVSSHRGKEFGVSEMDIRVEADMTSDVREQLVGYISGERFYFMSLGIGRGAVSHKAHEYPLHEALEARRMCAVNLRKLLLDAGAIECAKEAADVEIDLSEHALTRTSLSDLFK
ncbi:MAG: hypothetical protein K2M06_00865, partial [Muribaculaceae bacterium]|nr:hypothetical protein [Muribaculaceae bacterium]